ncbi:hypothetical protein [Labrys sp. 22185]|uniref:hypothetical protein n=1 Tax=Labrys sp. 22185 TaxID=3453888 RepID=UPI003F879571
MSTSTTPKLLRKSRDSIVGTADADLPGGSSITLIISSGDALAAVQRVPPGTPLLECAFSSSC